MAAETLSFSLTGERARSRISLMCTRMCIQLGTRQRPLEVATRRGVSYIYTQAYAIDPLRLAPLTAAVLDSINTLPIKSILELMDLKSRIF